jgi:hypothetical protein
MTSHRRPVLGEGFYLQFRPSDTLPPGTGTENAIALINSPEERIFMGWLRAWEVEDLIVEMEDVKQAQDPVERYLQGYICKIIREFQWETGGGLCTEGRVYIY